MTNSPLPPSTRHVAYLRNRIVMQRDAYYKAETFTSDGGIGGYCSKAAAARAGGSPSNAAATLAGRSGGGDSTTVELAAPIGSRGMEWFPPPAHGPLDDDWAGAALVVLGGTGGGQVAEIARSGGTTVTLREPGLPVPLDGSSEVVVVPYSGDAIYAGNHWADGTSVDYCESSCCAARIRFSARVL
eukprot:SAG11_NODE_1354_length_5128_cov_3.183337_4_plen_186_part_00